MSGLPRGWTTSHLGELLELKYGKSLPEKLRASGRFNVFGSNGVVGTHNAALTRAPTIVIWRKGISARSILQTSRAFQSIQPTTSIISIALMHILPAMY